MADKCHGAASEMSNDKREKNGAPDQSGRWKAKTDPYRSGFVGKSTSCGGVTNKRGFDVQECCEREMGRTEKLSRCRDHERRQLGAKLGEGRNKLERGHEKRVN